jgi:hypothetical protein
MSDTVKIFKGEFLNIYVNLDVHCCDLVNYDYYWETGTRVTLKRPDNTFSTLGFSWNPVTELGVFPVNHPSSSEESLDLVGKYECQILLIFQDGSQYFSEKFFIIVEQPLSGD